MKTLNQNAVRFIRNCIYFILIVLLLIMVFSCNPAKVAARKDEKALNRVTASRPLIDRMKTVVMDLYPCANDTFAVWIPGGVDSIPYPTPVLDSAQRRKIIDSLNTVFTSDCDVAINASYEAGYKNALIDLQKGKFAAKRPDTLQQTIVDKQRQNSDREYLVKLKIENANLQGQLSEKDKRIKEAIKEQRTWYWWFISAASLLVLTNAFWIFLKLKK